MTFTPVPLPAMIADLHQRLGLPAAEAELLARVAGGNLRYARELATSEDARRQRTFFSIWPGTFPARACWTPRWPWTR